MKKITSILFSMQTMGMLILIFAASIGVATFIENDYGPTAAKAVVYNAVWFDILLILLAINMVANVFIYKMYTKEKFTIFLFHISFLIVLLGAGITRFISYEGMMHIREGETVNTILSDKVYIEVELNDNNQTVTHSESTKLSILTSTAYKDKVSIGDKTFRFKSVKYVPNAQEVITNVKEGGVPYIIVVASQGSSGRQTFSMKHQNRSRIGSVIFNFGYNFDSTAVNLRYSGSKLEINPKDTIYTMSMAGDANDTLLPGTWYPFELRKLYTIGSLNIVMTNFYARGGKDFVPNQGEGTYMDAVVIEVSSGDSKKIVGLRGGKGYAGQPQHFSLDGVNFKMTYGSREIVLPFALKLNDFQLEHYPGSKSPSSYASEVTLIDKEKGVERPYRIFMNNVLNYRSYRFFQSSYDMDEMGTVLSVNHDWWGTTFTYIGYALMALGMFASLFIKSSRFTKLGESLRQSIAKIRSGTVALVLLLSFSGLTAFGQHTHAGPGEATAVDKELAADFGRLLVQSHDGRLKPINTLSSEILRKLARKNKMFGMNSDQVLLGMLSDPLAWQQMPVIKVKNKEIQKILGVDEKYASYLDLINMEKGSYKLSDYVSKAYARKPAQRDMFDKDLIKIDERLNISYLVFTGEFLKILPNPTDSHAPWFSPASHMHGLSAEDSSFVSAIIPNFLNSVKEGDLGMAKQLLSGIAAYQKQYGSDILPPESKTNMEITYNRMMIFDNLGKLYGLLGLIMIILVFIDLFRNSKTLRLIIKGMVVLVIIGFVLQTAGLGIRWYISGHAPWSDGYESLIYIAWVTLLAGLIFSRRSNMTIAATTILTSIILMVAHLSWMDPEITNLVPVLKSYWLTIHVSIITASYGFLALGMLLGFFNLLLMILKTSKNAEMLELRINNLTAINERALTIGLYMLTIGTFLGGVWANESWGRYWGWDPKETWALVSVLVYSFILHMRFIPGLKGNYVLNFASLIGYFSILMTYFGVNYYLSGLHSYASGDPVPVPDFVYYTVAVIIVIAIWAYVKERKYLSTKTSVQEAD